MISGDVELERSEDVRLDDPGRLSPARQAKPSGQSLEIQFDLEERRLAAGANASPGANASAGENASENANTSTSANTSAGANAATGANVFTYKIASAHEIAYSGAISSTDAKSFSGTNCPAGANSSVGASGGANASRTSRDPAFGRPVGRRPPERIRGRGRGRCALVLDVDARGGTGAKNIPERKRKSGGDQERHRQSAFFNATQASRRQSHHY